MSALQCSKSGCLATVSWLGHGIDPALAKFAKMQGWTHTESKGWICRHHSAALAPSNNEVSGDKQESQL